MRTVVELAAKAVAGGVLVVLFAVLSQMLSPKRFAGVFAAAPSVALAGLVVTLFAKGASSAQRSALGMVAGAVAFVVYALVTPATVRRLGALLGASVSIVGWLAVAAMGLAVVGVATSSKAAALGVAGRPEDVSGRPRLRLEPGKLSEAKPSELLVRFAFGAGVSAVAGTVSLVSGPLVGGAFLAFPAILLATLTMVADDEGQAAARDEARGAAAGALGLVAFASVATALFRHATPWSTLVAASAAWTVVALGTYGVAWLTGHGADEQVPRAAA